MVGFIKSLIILAVRRRAASGKVNIFTITLLGLTLLGLGTIIYQNKLHRDSEERITKNVWKEIEFRREIEDNVKQDIDAQKKNREFVIQLEAEKWIVESLKQEIADSENKLTQYYQGLEDAIATETENQKRRQQGHEEQLAANKNKLSGHSVLLQDSIKYSKSLGDKLAENEKHILRLEEKIDSLGKGLADYGKQLKDIYRQLRGLKEKQVIYTGQ